MDMSIEQYQEIKDYFRVLKMVKLGTEIDINISKNISLISHYSGSYIEMIEPFDKIISTIATFETHVSNYYSEDHEEMKKQHFTTTTFSESGIALMEKFKEGGDFLFYQIDSE